MNPHLARNARYSKTQSLLWVVFAYAAALAAAIAVVRVAEPQLGPIYAVLAADVVATVIIWLFGLPFSNASFYDPYWSVAPVAIAAYWWSLTGFDLTDHRKLLLMLVLVYWSVRLTMNWIVGWTGLVHEDWRYQNLRAGSGPFYQLVNLFGICMLPTLIVFLGMLPAYPVLAQKTAANPVLDIVALVVGLGAVTIQWVSDEQMRLFRKQAHGNEAVMDKGLWAWSRHPNYFGEVAMWASLFLFALSAGAAANAWTGVGVAAMVLLFVFISIPMMDKKSAAKRPAFAAHMKKSSAFLMWPPKKTSSA